MKAVVIPVIMFEPSVLWISLYPFSRNICATIWLVVVFPFVPLIKIILSVFFASFFKTFLSIFRAITPGMLLPFLFKSLLAFWTSLANIIDVFNKMDKFIRSLKFSYNQCIIIFFLSRNNRSNYGLNA